DLLPHRFHHRRMAVTQNQRAVAAEVIDVLVAVDVPLASALGAGNIDRMRPQIADVVRDAAGENVASQRVAIPRRGRLANVRFDNLRLSGCFHYDSAASLSKVLSCCKSRFMTAATSSFEIVSDVLPLSAPPIGYSKCSCSGPEKRAAASIPKNCGRCAIPR